MSGQRNTRLLLADEDGTLVTPDKQLTKTTRAIVGELHDVGIALPTSGRPPRAGSRQIEEAHIARRVHL